MEIAVSNLGTAVFFQLANGGIIKCNELAALVIQDGNFTLRCGQGIQGVLLRSFSPLLSHIGQLRGGAQPGFMVGSFRAC